MKKIFTFLLMIITSLTFVACKNTPGLTTSKSNLLNSVRYSSSGSNTKIDDEEYLQKLYEFSNTIYQMTSTYEDGNYALSPLSIYMALSVLHSLGDDGVKSDIETLFGMTAEDLDKTGSLFLSLIRELKEKDFDGNENVTSKLDLTNSIWIDDQIKTNQNALDRIAEDLFCYAYQTPFSSNVAQANKDIHDFIYEKTNGLIDSDFELDEQTLFAIINTLYFKDCWGFDDLPTETLQFNTNKGTKNCEFLKANYISGDVAETDYSYYLYATTKQGYKIKFIVPKENHTLSEAMSARNLNEVNSRKNYVNEKEKDIYTRCVFPSFRIESETKLKDILMQNNYLGNAFSGYTSDLMDRSLVVSEILHKAVVNVDKKGIEGAAYTIIFTKETAATPHKNTKDFVIDKNFGFLITTEDDIILFEGQVVNP